MIYSYPYSNVSESICEILDPIATMIARVGGNREEKIGQFSLCRCSRHRLHQHALNPIMTK